MPEFEKEEFKFPDEDNKDDKKSEFDIEYEGDGELKVEDDTPPEDRNRQPMPKEIVEKLEQDELETYSDDVRQKFKQLKKVWHDERRAKEAVAREHQEALTAAQRLFEENKRIKSMLSSGREYVSAVKNNTEMQLEMAKKAYREAYDSGDIDKQLEAQEQITRATMAMDRVKNIEATPLQEETDDVQPRQQAPRPDRRALAWQERNPWFGQDEEMTAAALGLHEKLKRNGVLVGSDEYYSVLDKTMRKRFAENFGEPERTEPEQREPAKRSPTVVAPATRSTSAKKVRLTQSQAAFIKRLGITPEQYVREVLKLEN